MVAPVIVRVPHVYVPNMLEEQLDQHLQAEIAFIKFHKTLLSIKTSKKWHFYY